MTPAEVERLLENQRNASQRAATVRLPPSWKAPIALPAVPPAQRSVVLPLPPSWNRAFKAAVMPVGGGRFRANVYKSKDAKDYAKAVAEQLAGTVPYAKGVMLRVEGVVTMERAGCDLDDRLKVLFDTLIGIVFEDDEQVAELHIVRRVDSKRPRVDLSFTVLDVDRYGEPLPF